MASTKFCCLLGSTDVILAWREKFRKLEITSAHHAQQDYSKIYKCNQVVKVALLGNGVQVLVLQLPARVNSVALGTTRQPEE
tara:strand:+ start:392 stop:637 length:246 start_codon:yes stop_codon:yes gene_type:complete